MPNIAKITVNVSDWNDEAVPVPMFQLLQWKAAIKLEILGMSHSRGSVAAHVREVLSAPSTYSNEDLLAYLSSVVADIQQQFAA